MGTVHQLPKALQVAVVQKLYGLHGPGLLRHRMTRAAQTDIVPDDILHLLKFLRRQLAERFDVPDLLKILKGFLALPAAVIVGGGGQFMRLVGVYDDQLRVSQLHRCVLIIQCRRVQEDGAVLLPHGRSELVHDPAVHSDEPVLRVLPVQGVLHLVRAEVVQGDQDLPGQHLQGRAGGKAGLVRDGPDADKIKAAVRLEPVFLKGPDHALHIVRPVVFLLINKIVQGRFDHARFREADREEAELPVISLPDRGVGSQGQRAGEDMSPVVVNVLSDQIHPSGREKDPAVAPAVHAVKGLLQFPDHLCFRHLSPPFISPTPRISGTASVRLPCL